MPFKDITEALKDEVRQICVQYPALKEDSAFVLWFLRAYLTDSEDAAVEALTGETSDKGIDAVFLDHSAKQAFLLQGKYRQTIGAHAESRNDVLALADMSQLIWTNNTFQHDFLNGISARVRGKFRELIRCVTKENYSLKLYYVTTGKCSDKLREESINRASQMKGDAELLMFDARLIQAVFKDYLEGVAPAVPSLTLRIGCEQSVQTDGNVYRFDPKTKIESWVFSMKAKDVGEMFTKAGIRLFARNIRGFLGDTEINRAIATTITTEPRNFWYYNNGITIVCDRAKKEQHRGEDVLRVDRPQVINGQQTVRTLSEAESDRASVLVKVIQLPRDTMTEDEYDDLVRKIVKATNWQNSIKTSDLVSNDKLQVFLEREMRRVGYHYLRKRQTKQEARALYRGLAHRAIKKDELAQAVAACIFDPVLVRKGKEGLFEEQYYRLIFGSRDIAFYLGPYWLMRRVQYVAHGKPRRAYMKWLVLNYAWVKMGQMLGTGENELRFRRACERQFDDVMVPLNAVIDGMFKAVDSFYRSERGHGEEAKDESTFFQLANLDQMFTQFWNSNRNIYKNRTEARIKEFETALGSINLNEFV
jgi:hypothetical protein